MIDHSKVNNLQFVMLEGKAKLFLVSNLVALVLACLTILMMVLNVVNCVKVLKGNTNYEDAKWKKVCLFAWLTYAVFCLGNYYILFFKNLGVYLAFVLLVVASVCGIFAKKR